jgi:hypothetical protein
VVIVTSLAGIGLQGVFNRVEIIAPTPGTYKTRDVQGVAES